MSSPICKKLVAVGDGACGKTCLLIAFSKNEFPVGYVPTVFQTDLADVVIDGRKVCLDFDGLDSKKQTFP